METPSAAPSPNLWQTMPQKLLHLSMHHLARLLVLYSGPQPSAPASTEMAMDLLLISLDLARLTSESRPGWARVELTQEGVSLAQSLFEMALGRPDRSSSPTTSAPTPTPPSTPVASQRPAPLSLVHSRA
jgi:hypothetical protein